MSFPWKPFDLLQSQRDEFTEILGSSIQVRAAVKYINFWNLSDESKVNGRLQNPIRSTC